MKKVVTLLTILLLLFSPAVSMSQTKPFIHFTEDDGLAGNKVTSILKDIDGYLWIGTENGLSRFDGRQFVNIRKGDGLPGNRVWALAADGKNRIYAGCYKDGLAVIENNKVTRVFHLKSQFPNSFRRLHYSKFFNVLVVGTDFGIYLFRDSVFYEIPYSKKIQGKRSVLSIVEHNQQIFFTSHTTGSFGGLYKLNVNRENPSLSTIDIIDKSIGNMFSLAVVNNTIYSNPTYQIYSYPIGKLTDKRPSAVANKQFLPWVSCPISDHEILLGGYGEGLFVCDLQTLNTYTGKLSATRYKIDPHSINDLLFDNDAEITWVCSDNGLFCLMKTPFETQELKDFDGVIDIAQKDNLVYILAKDGLYNYENGKAVRKFTNRELTKSIVEKRTKLRGSYSDYYPAAFNDLEMTFSHLFNENNQLFLVTSKGSISIPDLKTYLPFNSDNFISNTNGGEYFVPDYQPLQYFPAINKSSQHTNFTGDQGGISDIIKIIRVNDVLYLASFYNGLYAIKDGRIYYLNESNSTIDNYLTDIDDNDRGGVWCTSANGSLFNIGFANKLSVIRKLNEPSDGIQGENYKWLKFNNHNLYIGTNKGLTIIPVTQLTKPKIDSFQFYNQENGYDHLSAGSPFTDNYGNIYVRTSDKLIKITNTPSKHVLGKLAFQSIMLNNNSVSVGKLSEKILPYSTEGMVVDFSLIKYPSSKNTKYHYRVNAGNWNEGSRVSLQSLKSGKYSIDFEANDIENHSVYRKQLSFEIALPVWQEWWFLLLVVITVGLISYSIAIWRIKTFKKKQEEKNRLIRTNSDLQIQSLQVQMNPHFVFNSLNSIQNFILSSKIEDAVLYLGHLGTIIRMNLENVSKDYIHLEEEMQFLKKYIAIEKLRFKEKLDIRLINNVTDQSMLIPPMLVQPIIENAIKHGIRHLSHSGTIQVVFAIHSGLLHVTIEDNGVGRTQAAMHLDKNHKSLGLALIKKRLLLLNEKTQSKDSNLYIEDLVDNGQPCGTKVKITLKIIRAT